MTVQERLFRAVKLLAHVKFAEYRFVIHLHGENTLQMFAEYEEADTYTGVVEVQRTRRWNLTPEMTDSEVVSTAFKLCLTSMEHRTREAFQYKGARIYSPHYDVEDLVELCQSRENAGARHE